MHFFNCISWLEEVEYLRAALFASTLTLIVSVSFERFMALRLLHTYEQRGYPSVFALCLASSAFAGVFWHLLLHYGWLARIGRFLGLITEIINMFSSLCVGCFYSLSNYAFFTLFRRHCFKLYNGDHTDALTQRLNIRFQLSENVRTAAILARMSLLSVCMDMSNFGVSAGTPGCTSVCS